MPTLTPGARRALARRPIICAPWSPSGNAGTTAAVLHEIDVASTRTGSSRSASSPTRAPRARRCSSESAASSTPRRSSTSASCWSSGGRAWRKNEAPVRRRRQDKLPPGKRRRRAAAKSVASRSQTQRASDRGSARPTQDHAAESIAGKHDARARLAWTTAARVRASRRIRQVLRSAARRETARETMRSDQRDCDAAGESNVESRRHLGRAAASSPQDR